MRLIQFITTAGQRAVAAVDASEARTVAGAESVYVLALAAMARSTTLAALVTAHGLGEPVDPVALAAENRLLPPIDHPDPAHLTITGTGLTHLGSATTRDAMHQATLPADATLTDSMKMFRLGLEGGKPAPGQVGVEPEWFFKGNGHGLVPPGAALLSPAFGRDAGEEPEIAGLYVIDADGQPRRLGFALANEFSDHVTERLNYLYLAHSKLRPCAIGPELRLGELPAQIEGVSRIWRAGKVLWEKPFLSGEANMSHSIANLEYHHFKYAQFRRPGDVHVHMFGTATLSFADGISTLPGDTFEIEAEPFGLPLRNTIAIEPAASVTVTPL